MDIIQIKLLFCINRYMFININYHIYIYIPSIGNYISHQTGCSAKFLFKIYLFLGDLLVPAFWVCMKKSFRNHLA